jgi:hypothetical protein
MTHKNTPYPFDGMPDENYFGEFRELSSSIGSYNEEDKEKDQKRLDSTESKKSEDTFTEFIIYPKI